MGFREARKRAGISAADAAAAIGVSEAAISQWETGIYTPRVPKLPKLAKLYGCTVDELLTDNVSEHESDKTD